jgi:multidrug resistance efflux pump
MKSEPVTAASTPNNPLEATMLHPDPKNPHQSETRLPGRSKGWSGRRLLLTGITAGLIVVGAIAALFIIRNPLQAARPDLVLHKVKHERLELVIVERGTLESGNNSDIYCRVKSGSKNTTVATTIKNLIDDGSAVKGPPHRNSYWGSVIAEGDVVVELDDSGLQEQLKTQKITVDKAYSDKIQAEEALKITISQNDADLISAQTKVDLAIIDLMKYTGLAREQVVQNRYIGGLVPVQVIQVRTINDLKYYLQGQAAQSDKLTAAIKDYIKNQPALPDKASTAILQDKLREALAASGLKDCYDANSDQVIKNFTRKLAEEDLKKFASGDYRALLQDALGQIENATSDLNQQEDREAWALRMAKKGYQTPSQAQAETLRKESYLLTVNKAQLNLQVLVRFTKDSQLTGYITALEEAQRTLERTRIQAPAKQKRDSSDQATKDSVWRQELARYEDVLNEIRKCRIYAGQDGMVVYFIPEQARNFGGSQQSIVAQGEPVREGQKLMQIPDLKHMLVNTKVHEALVSRVKKGQPATIRVESFPDRTLHGKVESVATVPAQGDFLSSDVKVYPTKVAINAADIDEKMNLKPGMSANVTISVSQVLEQVLAVPIQAIVGGPEMGNERKVLVMTPEGPKERTVHVGAYTTTMAEIKEGLEEGEEVVLNPKVVLGDKMKTRDGDKGKSGKGAPGDKTNPAAGTESPGAGGRKK